jgi:hypothetical protein
MAASPEPRTVGDPFPVEFTWVDSEVAAVQAMPEGIEIRLSAAHLCGAPERYLPGVVLRLQAQLQAGNPQQALGRVVAASLILQGRAADRLPVPSQTEAAFTLSLWFGHGALLQLQGHRLDVRLPRDPRIMEHLSC